MILELEFCNFKCFRDRISVNFFASKTSKLAGNMMFATPHRERVVKAMAFYGYNASGKTTVLDALHALGAFVLFSAQDQKPTARIPEFESFALDKEHSALPAEVKLTLQLGNHRYMIAVGATRDRVVYEKLISRDMSTARSRKAPPLELINREWADATSKYVISLNDSLGLASTLASASEQTPENRLLLGKLAALNNEVAKRIIAWFDDELDFYDMHRNPESEQAMLEESARMLKTDDAFASLVGRFARDADIGVTALHATEEQAFEPVFSDEDKKFEFKSTKRPGISFKHNTEDGSEVIFRARKESSGTRRFIALLTAILKPSSNRRVVCIDELSASLHPALVQTLLKIVHSSKYNPNGNQVLFTSHDTHLINPNELLRRDQIVLCNKDQFGRSSLTRLDSFQDNARSDANLQKQYLEGRFGGLPLFGPSLEDIPADDKPLEVAL